MPANLNWWHSTAAKKPTCESGSLLPRSFTVIHSHSCTRPGLKPWPFHQQYEAITAQKHTTTSDPQKARELLPPPSQSSSNFKFTSLSPPFSWRQVISSSPNTQFPGTALADKTLFTWHPPCMDGLSLGDQRPTSLEHYYRTIKF